MLFVCIIKRAGDKEDLLMIITAPHTQSEVLLVIQTYFFLFLNQYICCDLSLKLFWSDSSNEEVITYGLMRTELQIKGGIKDNSKIIFLISQQKQML